MLQEKYETFKEYIRKKGFDLDIESYPKLKKVIKHFAENNDMKGLEAYLKQCQNCGGYALQIPACIFSGNDYTFEEQVLRIMELYPFVRLLSNSELKQSEYIVIFRSGETGHHFIRVDENGVATNKNEGDLPEKFKGWRTLENAEEATFAVLKQEYRSDEIKDLPQCNTSIFLDQDAYYEIEEDGYKSIRTKEATKPITFMDKLKEAYKNKQSSFSYLDKSFHLKINKNDSEMIYICNDNEVLGDIYANENEFIIELDDKKQNEIYGFKPNKELKLLKEENKEK